MDLKELGGLQKIQFNINEQIGVVEYLIGKQGDYKTRGLEIQLLCNNMVVDATGIDCEFYGKHHKSEDVYMVIATNKDVEQGIYEILYPSKLMEHEGILNAEIRFTKEDKILSTHIFNVDVKKTLITDDIIEGINEQRLIDILIDAAKSEEERVQNEKVRKSDEIIRKENEDNRIVEENTRKSSENIRVENEDTRKQNEDLRRTEEQKRKNAETNRLSEENIRKTNEQSRVLKEQERNSSEASRISEENIRISNENTRKSNESDRKSNEFIRVSKEQERVLAEGDETSGRIKGEIDRKNAEQIRITNENTRKDNEIIRQQNETEREKFKHNHDNKPVIDNLDENEEGFLTYNGQEISGDVRVANEAEEVSLEDTIFIGDTREIERQLEEDYATKEYARNYTDSQITLITETGIPKLSVFEYKFPNLAVGIKTIQIPLDTFDKQTDTVKLYINTVPRDSDYFTVSESGLITLTKALEVQSRVVIEVWKNIPIGEDGSVSGKVIAIDSLPSDRVQGLGSASTLDHEEGTWTPVAVSETMNVVSSDGFYIKIGKKVDCWYRIELAASEGNLIIEFGGLPYPLSLSPALPLSFPLGDISALALPEDAYNPIAYLSNSTSRFSLRYTDKLGNRQPIFIRFIKGGLLYAHFSYYTD